jgi:hypothetical protein
MIQQTIPVTKECKSGYKRDICTLMFIAALFTVAKLCPTTDEWIKETWYIYTMEYFSAIRKNEMMSLACK